MVRPVPLTRIVPSPDEVGVTTAPVPAAVGIEAAEPAVDVPAAALQAAVSATAPAATGRAAHNRFRRLGWVGRVVTSDLGGVLTYMVRSLSEGEVVPRHCPGESKGTSSECAPASRSHPSPDARQPRRELGYRCGIPLSTGVLRAGQRAGELATRGDAELAQHLVHVELDGGDSDEQPGGD